MKKFFTLTISLFLICLSGNAKIDYSNPSDNDYIGTWGKIKLVGNQLCSESGEPIQLRGWSTFGYSGEFGKAFDDQSDFNKMKSYGANFARITQYINEGWTYGVRTDWVKNCIDYCANAKMYCLVDWHIRKPGNPNDKVYEGYADFFDEITLYVEQKGYKHVLYEISNEPNDDVEGDPAAFDYVWDWIKNYTYNVLPIIAERDPNAVVCIGTPQWDIDVTRAFQSPIEIKDSYKDLQIMYSFHHYAADQQKYLGILSAAAAFVPVFITEWSLSDQRDDGFIDTKAGDHMLAVANGKNLGGQIISWANWKWCDKGDESSAWNGGQYGNSLSQSGRYVIGKLGNGDQFSYCESTPYTIQEFDGVNDSYLDLSAYDKGGQDNAYFDYDGVELCLGNDIDNTKPCNAGTTGDDGFRPGEYVDMGYVDETKKEQTYKCINHIKNGEWVSYTINVGTPGNYEFEILACNHKSNKTAYDSKKADSYNIFGITVDGKPGLVANNGDSTIYQALYLPPCKGGENGDYNTWGWVTPYSGDVDNAYDSKNKHTELKYRIRFKTAGTHTLSLAFMTANSGVGALKLKGNEDTAANDVTDESVSVWSNAENSAINVFVTKPSFVKVVNSRGVVIYANEVESDVITQINDFPVADTYIISVSNSDGTKTKKIVLR